MLSQDKTGLLKAFLAGLPEPVAARLAHAVEVDRLMDGKALPHDDILDSLRPALRREGRDRLPTPLRLFLLPVQDLLSSAPVTREKQKAVIARASVMPVWNWLAEVLLPDDTAAYVADMRRHILSRDGPAMEACADHFRPLAAEAIEAALAADIKHVRLRLGAQAMDDAAEMAMLFPAAPALARIQGLLPEPVPTLGEEMVWSLRAVYDALIESHPHIAPYVAVVAMNRLARPWEALRLPLNITRHNQESMLAQTDMGLVGEILFARMERLQTAILSTRHPLFDADLLLEQVSQFAGLSSGMSKEFEMRRNGEWGGRILKDRGAVGKVMNDLMERAPREIGNAMPMLKAQAADLSRPISSEKQVLALRYARLVVGSRNFAAAASFGARQKDAYDEASAHLRRYVEDLVRELHDAAPQTRAIAEVQLAFCVQLTSLLFSNQEAELLQRRGRAAQAAA